MIKVHLQGVESVRQRLRTLKSRGENIRPLLDNIAEIMRYEVAENFDEEGRDPSWPKSQRAIRDGGKTLQDTGQLLSSIQTFVQAKSAGVATNKVYAAIHNFGGTIVRKPYSGSVRLRTNAKGDFLRQGSEGLKANLAVFARSGHKRAVSRSFTSSGYSITMPKREFMKLSSAGIGQIEQAAATFLTSP